MKFFTSKRIKRFICILSVVVLLFNVVAPTGIVLEAQAGVGGLLLGPIAMLFGGIAFAFQALLNGLLGVGEVIAGGALPESDSDLFISDIVYNTLPITNANIFSSSNPNPLFNADLDGESTGLKGIISKWYQVTRLIALASTLVMLVYVAIQILLSSTGSSKAKYKDLLKDWLVCLLLIFTMHYILAAIMYVCDWIVAFFLTVASSSGVDPYELVQKWTFAWSDFSIIYAIIWIVLLVFTFIIFIAYVKRLFLICFIVVISPLVIMASTIDKLRGKGGGLLGNMLKEFIANALVQPMDAILFTILFSAFAICMQGNLPLPAIVFIIVFFMLRKWIQKFLGQSVSEGSAGQATAGGAAVMGMAGKSSGKLNNVGKSKPKLPQTKTPNLNTSNMKGGAKGGAGASAGTKPGAIASASTYAGGSTGAGYINYLNSSGSDGSGFSEVDGDSSEARDSAGSSTSLSRAQKVKMGLAKAAPVAGRLSTAIASKGIGVAAGIGMASLNMAAGKSAMSGFASGYGAGSGLTASAMNAGGRLGGKAVSAGKAGASVFKEDGFKGVASSVGSSIGNFAADKAAGSSILHGSKAATAYKQEREDGMNLANFYSDENNRSFLLESAEGYMDESQLEEYNNMNDDARYAKALETMQSQSFADANARKLNNMSGSDYHKQLELLSRQRKQWGKNNGD